MDYETQILVPPCDDQTLPLRNPYQCIFASATQQTISPDCLHPKLDQPMAPAGLMMVGSSLRNRCFVGEVRIGLLHLQVCENLWCVGGEIVTI